MTALALAQLLARIARGVFPLVPLMRCLAFFARLAPLAATHLDARIRRAVLPGAPDMHGLSAFGLAAFADPGLGASAFGAVVPGAPRVDPDFTFQFIEHSRLQIADWAQFAITASLMKALL
jgi:hypothetical protein